MRMHDFFIKRKVNIFWILYGLVLIFLFLLSSTDLIIKEEEAKVYPISVIIGDTSDDNYVNFRKGMERAAIEYNGDVSFITLYEKGSARQQRELMLREQEDGSQALIVVPVEEELLADMQIPLICVNGQRSLMDERDNVVVLTFDYYNMGRRMGEEILKRYPAKEEVYLLEGEKNDTADKLFSEGIGDALVQKECVVLPPGFFRESDVELQLEEMVGEKAQGIVLVASDPGGLLEAAQFLSETEGAERWIAGLFGRGNTVPILNYLGKGIIQGLSVTDDFSAGYLSVKAAVEILRDHSVEDMGYLESHYIRQEDLRNEKYEKMLYPIE